MKKFIKYGLIALIIYVPVRINLVHEVFGLRRFVVKHIETGEIITHIAYKGTNYVIAGNHFFLPDTNYLAYKDTFLNEYGFDLYWGYDNKKWLCSASDIVENKLDTTKYLARDWKIEDEKRNPPIIDSLFQERTTITCQYNIFVALGCFDEIDHRDSKKNVEISYWGF